MVEQVARAIYTEFPLAHIDDVPFSRLGHLEREVMMLMAKAAIQAMRNPPEIVIRTISAYGVCAGETALAWEKAIDAALSEGK